MDNEIKKLEDFVNEILYDIRNAHIDVDNISPKYKQLAEELDTLRGDILEMYDSLANVAEGKLENMPQNSNPYSGSFKQHVANLRHLTWQVKCVADGDYAQRVDFLGEFADSFNIMIKQLKHKEQLAKENEKMQQLIFKQRQEALQKSLESQLTYFEKMEKQQKEMRSFRHDIKNHYLILQSLLGGKNYDGAMEYLEKMVDVSVNTNSIASSGNYILDALLSEKCEVAKRKGIEYNVDMGMPMYIQMDSMDICILFGNALDNAIEACEASTAKPARIDIKFVKRGHMFNAVIKNTSDNSPQKRSQDGLYETSKENSELHGIGMKNMESIVEKYNGFMKSFWENGEFTLTILLSGV